MARRQVVTTLSVTSVVLGALLGLFLFPAAGSPIGKWLIKLPSSRDPLLVGEWRGSWRFMDDPSIRPKVVTLLPDGTGKSFDGRTHWPFNWGTEAGVFYARRMATDAWSGTSHRYHVSVSGRNVQFLGRIRMFDLVSSDMRRQ